MSIQILIVDDHGVLRAGLRALLNVEPDLEVIVEVADDHEIIRVVNEELNPNITPSVIILPLKLKYTRNLFKMYAV